MTEYKFDEPVGDAIKELSSKQEPLVVKDGVAQIDPSHPDYKFWMEED